MLTKEKIIKLVKEMEKFPLEKETIQQVNDIFYSYDNTLPSHYDIVLILTSSSIQRIKKAIEIYQQKKVKILISGGSKLTKENLIEAEKFYIYAVCHGIDPEDMILELKSQNTYDNFKYSFSILQNLSVPCHHMILITNANHMPRALLTGEKVSKELDFPIKLYPVVSYASLLPPEVWQENRRAVQILRDELEKLIQYELI